MLSVWVRHHLHQTPVSRGLRRVPGARALAERWWLFSQGSALKSALSSIKPPIGVESDMQREIDLPTILEIEAREPTTVEQGDAFSSSMSVWCDTSKFQSLGYQDVYARVVSHLVDASPRVLEVGIGVNDPSSPSGMEPSHQPGASLVGWARFFPGSEVHGADIDRRVLIDTDLYSTHWVDQRDGESLASLVRTVGAPMDLVVDDGLHTPEANGLTVAELLPYLSRQGILVVEDILPEYDVLWSQAYRWLPPHYGVLFYPGKILRGDRDEGVAVFWRHQ